MRTKTIYYDAKRRFIIIYYHIVEEKTEIP